MSSSPDLGKSRVATVFVDNLPKDVWKVWLYNLFSKFGKIQSIYIPNKKSKLSGNQFGFVRMGSPQEAIRAIKEMNGLWIWGRTLVANIVRFGDQNKREHIQSIINIRTGITEEKGQGLSRGHGGGMKLLSESKYAKDLPYNKLRDKSKNRAQVWRKKEATTDQMNQRNSWESGNFPTLKVGEYQIKSVLKIGMAKLLWNSSPSLEFPNFLRNWKNLGRALSKSESWKNNLWVNTVLRTDCACPGCQVEVPTLNHNLAKESVQSTSKSVNGGDTRSKIPLIEEVAEAINYPLQGFDALDEKPKRKQRSVEDILGLSKPTMTKKGGRRGKQKCVVVRSAMAAAALSVSTEGITNRNKILISESKAAWSVTKILGTDYMGSMKILSLNVRGLGKREKRSKVTKLLSNLKVDMLLLQETKLKDLKPIILQSIWGISEILGDVLARFKELQRWNLHFKRALLDRKTEALKELNELLAVFGVVVAFDRPDQLVWRGCSSVSGSGSQGSKCFGLQFPLAVGWAAWNVRIQKVFDNKPVDWLEATELIIARVAF
ncbi:hypothetical protein Acr_21g0005160 [Actinidia rufa]|uniref:RRM domain-containing protein n=1 Tax=Actinidia rufa TaxID=165716 RepID=A0A7J0GGG4_9ERIC|nr:hypothetical protein Acr_21g0005160 [Actinidia rufa]